MKTALLQLSVSDNPEANLPRTLDMIAQAHHQGAQFVLTPEVTNCISSSRARQNDVLVQEHEDITLASIRAQAKELRIHVLIGSLALKTTDPDGRFANRSFMIGPSGEIIARYDKIHMFDVEISSEESYRESAGYRPGDQAVLAQTAFGTVGLSICYDLRFPALASALTEAGATILTYPSAFSPATGAAHWHSLLRARAIEAGAWVLAPAQTGKHEHIAGKARFTYGHSLVVDPWGRVLVDAGEEEGIYSFELDSNAVFEARRRIPSLKNRRVIVGP